MRIDMPSVATLTVLLFQVTAAFTNRARLSTSKYRHDFSVKTAINGGTNVSTVSSSLDDNETPSFGKEPLTEDTVDSIRAFNATTSKLSQTDGTQAPTKEFEDLNEAPPLSFEKFMTMQDKRVIVTIRYSGDAGLKPYFLTIAKKLKASHPDVMIERRILADVDDEEDEATFEVLVDGKIVIGRGKKQTLSRAQTMVFVSMQELDIAISRARRRRRPSTAYGGEKK